MSEVHIPAVSVGDTWTKLKSDAGAVLVDVRTIAEWAYVGLPDLSAIGKQPVLVEWQGFPDNRLNSAFVERLTEALAQRGADKGTEIFFICRSGRPQSQCGPGDGGGRLYALPQRGGRLRGATRSEPAQGASRRLEGQRVALDAGMTGVLFE